MGGKPVILDGMGVGAGANRAGGIQIEVCTGSAASLDQSKKNPP